MGWLRTEATYPCFSAMDLVMYLAKAWRSAVTSALSNSQLISNWPLPSSWSAWYGPQPSASIAVTISEMKSYRFMSAAWS